MLLSTITGTVFSDRNGDGVQDNGEPGLSGITVFLDANNNGILDSGETTATTDSNGNYSFTVSSLKTYDVAQVVPSGFAQIKPVGNAVATQNVDITRSVGNEAEAAIAIDPTNPNRMFMASVIGSGNFLKGAYSTDGGVTWNVRNVATGTGTGGDGLTAACCDPSLAWDAFGNLFMVYLNSGDSQAIVARSTNGGQSFTQIATFGDTFVDQPTIVTGPGQNGSGGSVWLFWNQPVNGVDILHAAGASVSALGSAVSFSAPVTIPNGTGSFGDIAVGPQGQVMVVYQQTGTNNNPSQIYMNVDPDSLGSQPFGPRSTLFTTNVGDFYNIPAQNTRTIDSEVGLAWDRSGGPHNGRVYLLDTDAAAQTSSDTNIFVRYSDNNGTSWSTPVRVNDDNTNRSQFLPRIALDQTTGDVAVSWYDCRNDDGLHGPGDTDGAPNDDAQFFGAVSTDFGASFSPNLQLSAGTSNAADSGDTIEFGDYTGLAFQSGKFFPVWADNSNSTGDNPNGTLHQFDVYTARVNVLPPGTPGRYSVVASGTQGAANLNFADHDTVAPTVSITAVTPNPRTTPVSSMTITFSEPVTGFDLSDLRLTRNGSPLSLASATLTTNDNTTYALGNLQSLTSVAGAYVLTLNASGSGIQDLSGNALAGGASTAFTVNSTVTARLIFYNHSYWNDPANGFTDDNAVDTSKTALLRGGTGSFANYTGSAMGINGIMIDIAGLPTGTPTGSDFGFKFGNDNNPSAWATAPAPTNVLVRRGAGTGGSDRAELIWSDNTIQDTWLQITVNADAATGLASPDVFYFGNSIGETGDSTTDTFVNAGDFIGVRDHPANFSNRALPSNPYDFNHDSFVDGTDLIITRDNVNNFTNALKFITPPANPAPEIPATSSSTPTTSASLFLPPPQSRHRDAARPRMPRVWD